MSRTVLWGRRVRITSATRRNIYMRSEPAGQRVTESVTSFIEKRLKIKANAGRVRWLDPRSARHWGSRQTHSGVGRASAQHSRHSMRRFKVRVRETTRRNGGVSMKFMVEELSAFLRDWRAPFRVLPDPRAVRYPL